MASLFPRWSNTATKLVLGALALLVLGVPALILGLMRTPWVTGANNPVEQPVEFDHRHHVRDDGIDCRYCHYTVESSASAGMPPTSLCMNCHNQIWTSSPLLARVRESYFAGRPIEWRRVYNVPDFVYFDHSVHVNRGVGCVSCHGRVDQQARVEQVPSLQMNWCLECHRSPERFLRPRDQVTNMEWTPPGGDQLAVGRQLVESGKVRRLVHCSACHR